MLSRGDPRANLKQYKDGAVKTSDEKLDIIEDAFNIVAMGQNECKVMDVAEYLAEDKDKVQSKRKWIYRAVKEIPDDFIIEDGVIKRVKNEEVK